MIRVWPRSSDEWRVEFRSGLKSLRSPSETALMSQVTPEVKQLLATLEDQRTGILKKLSGLSEDDARRSTVDSGTNLAGLVQHLTFVESKWFEGIVAGRTPRG